MKKDSVQVAANVAKVGLVLVWGIFMYCLIKSHLQVMSVFVKVTQELLTQEQCVQVFNNELGGVQLRLIENFSENSFIMYLTSTEAKALARMLNEVADK